MAVTGQDLMAADNPHAWPRRTYCAEQAHGRDTAAIYDLRDGCIGSSFRPG